MSETQCLPSKPRMVSRVPNVRMAWDVRGRGSFPGIEDPALITLELKSLGSTRK